jgi:anhydro-N-acetylmuramic acid kinase
MVYKVIGLMSGSSLDGLDLAYVHLQKGVITWEYELLYTVTYPYPDVWRQRLAAAPGLSAFDYQLLHVEYGAYLGESVLRFIEGNGLQYAVQLIASHGHTVFHAPARKMTAQLGDGAAIAAKTGINVVSELRAMDVALGGQGAPIVPIGERLLLPGYDFFLNLGGIANISRGGVAFDVAPANRVLNELAGEAGLAFDRDGMLAAAGTVDEELLGRLNALAYYALPYPKSLANDFGTDTVLPMVRAAGLSTADALRTYVEHIVEQVSRAVEGLEGGARVNEAGGQVARMLITGGGAHNKFLVERLKQRPGVEPVVPGAALVDYKEALIMALIGVLRWREENNVLASVTGASRDSIGGAVYIGQEV